MKIYQGVLSYALVTKSRTDGQKAKFVSPPLPQKGGGQQGYHPLICTEEMDKETELSLC